MESIPVDTGKPEANLPPAAFITADLKTGSVTNTQRSLQRIAGDHSVKDFTHYGKPKLYDFRRILRFRTENPVEPERGTALVYKPVFPYKSCLAISQSFAGKLGWEPRIFESRFGIHQLLIGLRRIIG